MPIVAYPWRVAFHEQLVEAGAGVLSVRGTFRLDPGVLFPSYRVHIPARIAGSITGLRLQHGFEDADSGVPNPHTITFTPPTFNLVNQNIYRSMQGVPGVPALGQFHGHFPGPIPPLVTVRVTWPAGTNITYTVSWSAVGIG